MASAASIAAAHPELDLNTIEGRAGLIMLEEEASLSWDREFRNLANNQSDSRVIAQAMEILTAAREHDRSSNPAFGCQATETMPPKDSLMFGNGWALNKDAIVASETYKLCRDLPAGFILHMHQNTGLMVKQLLDFAKRTVRRNLYVNSDIPLTSYEAYQVCEMTIEVMAPGVLTGDCFATNFIGREKPGATKGLQWMHYDDFRAKFAGAGRGSEAVLDQWLIEKIELTTDDCCGTHSNCNTMWYLFNAGTRGFKGLVNYESGFKFYMQELFKIAIAQGVPYMEHRIMVLDKCIKKDDGTPGMDLVQQMVVTKQIGEEVVADLKRQCRFPADFEFLGARIIGGIPRNLPDFLYEPCLATIRELKAKGGDMFVAADILGCEDRAFSFPFHLLEEHEKLCKEQNLVIPWAPHAGESLNMYAGGKKPEFNSLSVALAMGSKRIGHGFALARHPKLMEKVAQQGVFVECMPISNEKLGLAPTPMAHPFPILLMAGVKLVISNDNPHIQRNASLYHDDMYQMFVGWSEMTGYGLAQMAFWSIDACFLSDKQKRDAKALWMRRFVTACERIVASQ